MYLKLIHISAGTPQHISQNIGAFAKISEFLKSVYR